MKNESRDAYNAYVAQVALVNGVPDAGKKFTVAPTVEQTLMDRVAEQADFLRDVNIIGVDQQSGNPLNLGVSGPAASRTNTTTTDRIPRNLVDLSDRTYMCKKTDFDTFITYEQVDTWAKFPDFQVRMRNQTVQQIARDKLMIGWNGTSAAATTDIATYPLLQDVNIGWLQKLRTEAPARVMSGIKIGDQAGADYKTLDAAVTDAGEELLDEWHREAPDIKAIMGRGLLADKYMGLIETAGTTATEMGALKTLLTSREVGGRIAQRVPYFPAKSILITAPKNLSLYFQTGTARRQVVDNAKRDRVEDYVSISEAYVIEDLGKACLIENIQVPNGAGGWM